MNRRMEQIPTYKIPISAEKTQTTNSTPTDKELMMSGLVLWYVENPMMRLRSYENALRDTLLYSF